MAYDEELAGRVRALLGHEAAEEKRMFGGLAFLVDGRMGVAVGGQGDRMVRVDPAEAEGLLAQAGVERVVMGDRGPMRGWVTVSSSALADDTALRAWVERGVAAARAA